VADALVTHYTRSADRTSLAYHVGGDGPIPLAFVSGGSIPIDLISEDPGFLRFSKRLGTFSRTVWFEPRGTGASEGNLRDAWVGEASVADLSAVLDAVGFEQAALAAWGSDAAAAIRFSVAHGDRVRALVLFNSFAHYVREDDYPWGIPREDLDQLVAAVKDAWGTGLSVAMLAPSRSTDERLRSWWGRVERLGLGPDQMAEGWRASLEEDVRPLLPSVTPPTLVLHRVGCAYDLGVGEYLAEHIPDARFVALPGDEFPYFMGDVDALADEIEEFLTGERAGAAGDVVTATVLFTDIVGSTEQQARIGQREWSQLTDRHDAMVRTALTRNRGREIKTTGDGFLATFDATGRALRCASEILTDAQGVGVELRAGLHTGDVELRSDDVVGLAVSIAKRVCDLAKPGQLLVSETVRVSTIASGFTFEDHGEHQLKGVPGTWRLHALAD
jgi:class 3 adenylate cyclase/pimeloyl-ACP methyl ester carboxylesterase